MNQALLKIDLDESFTNALELVFLGSPNEAMSFEPLVTRSDAWDSDEKQ